MIPRSSLHFALLLAAVALPASAAVIGINPPAQPLTMERIADLPAELRGPWMDYLSRSNVRRAADHAFVAAELKAAGRVRPVVPREGRGGMPLNQPADWYGKAEARKTADVIISYQTPNGGCSKNLNMRDQVRQPGEGFIADNASPVKPVPGDFGTSNEPHWNYFGTLDNDATTTQLRFLARVITAIGPDRGAAYRASFLRGIDYLFAAQFPNGGWPQVWPLQGGYHDGVTYNDDAVVQALEVLQGVADGTGIYAFTPPELRPLAARRVARGVACILKSQIVTDGRTTVWCQQHDPLTLKPASARNYEPPVQCTGESSGIVTFLMSLPNPSPRVVASVHAAAAWFKKVAIHDQVWSRRKFGGGGGAPGPRPAPGITHLLPQPGAPRLWARYYETGTDRPVFGDRDKTIHDRIEEISVERQNGYQWFNSEAEEMLATYATWSVAHPPAVSQ